jgi:hypothetical protein
MCGAIGGLAVRQIGIGGLPVVVGAVSLCMLVGIDVVRATPSYCNVFQWIRANIEYHRQPDEYVNVAQAHVRTDSTLRAAVQTSKKTRDETNVKRLYPPHGLVERTDDALVSILKYEAPNMDFATGEQYQELKQQIQGWYNDSIDFDITVYISTRPVEMGDYLENLSDRMDDPDVQGRDVFRAVLEEMVEGRKASLEDSDTETVEFYFIVDVEKNEVDSSIGGDDSASDRSALFSLFGSSEQDLDADDKAVRRARMEKLLGTRIEKIRRVAHGSGLSVDAEIRQLNSLEAAALLERFWTGRDVVGDTSTNAEVPTSGFSRGPLTKEELEIPASENEVEA